MTYIDKSITNIKIYNVELTELEIQNMFSEDYPQ